MTRVFAEFVEDRKSETLLEIIRRHVHPGTLVCSDQWKGYLKCARNGYFLAQVNHSENFISPQCPLVHSQTVERSWRSLKNIFPKSTHGDTHETYLDEYLYRAQYFGKK